MATLQSLFDYMERVEDEQAFDSVERFSERGHWILTLGENLRIDLVADAEAGEFSLSAPVVAPHASRRLVAAEIALVASQELALHTRMAFGLTEPGGLLCLNVFPTAIPDDYEAFAAVISDFSLRVANWQAGWAALAEPAAEETPALNFSENLIRI